MLTGRALSSHKKFFGSSASSSSLTRDDWSAIKETFSRFDEVMAILRLLPTSMILVLRNINIVRSLNRELGSPVNRFNIMSKR
jgi:aarF domain-containing kinase